MIITFMSRQGMKTSKIIKTIHTSMDEIAAPIKLWHIRRPLVKAFRLSQTLLAPRALAVLGNEISVV